MFSGIQEILLVGAIVAAIFLIPRMTASRKPTTRVVPQPGPAVISRGIRIAIVLSIFWPAAWAFFLEPWQHDLTGFVIVGIGPVLAGWSLKWILAGKTKKR